MFDKIKIKRFSDSPAITLKNDEISSSLQLSNKHHPVEGEEERSVKENETDMSDVKNNVNKCQF